MDILRLERLGAPVASGGQLITGQNPHSSGPAASTLLAKLGEIGTGPWEHHLPEDRSGPASHSPGGDWPAHAGCEQREPRTLLANLTCAGEITSRIRSIRCAGG